MVIHYCKKGADLEKNKITMKIDKKKERKTTTRICSRQILEDVLERISLF